MAKLKPKDLYRRFVSYKQSQRLVGVLVVIIVAGIGVRLLTSSHATSYYASSEASSGTLTGSASVFTDPTASGGSAVRFGGGTTTSAPATPAATGAVICGDTSLLNGGPTMAPAGAVTVPAGDDSVAQGSYTKPITENYNLVANTVYWFAPGTHTFGTSQFGQVQPQNGDTFIGAPGAIIDGQGDNESAFTQHGTNVTIEYLTVQHFVTPEGQMVVNHDGGANWTIKYNLIQNNGGAGVGLGSNDVVTQNCLTHNDEYGFSSFGGSTNVTFSQNEVSFNDGNSTGGGKYDQGGSTINCGCSGGGKFWDTSNATVTDNYVHDNGDVGIWPDTDNAGFNISNNYIANNYAEGIIYEISYNFQIENNTFIGNAVAAGPGPDVAGFPDSALYVSESGSDSRVNTPYNTQSVISGNVFTNNWGGVVIYENANRYCSGSDQYCTLVDPSVYTIPSCAANLPEKSPTDYYDNCRWKAQNVLVTHNTFNFTPSADGSACTLANWCGYNGLFSNFGSTFYTGASIPFAISYNQNDHFSDNTYEGPWNFTAWNQGNSDNWATWSGPLTTECPATQTSGFCSSDFGQDAGSTYN